MKLIKFIVWVCIAGIVVGTTGGLAVFILPLLWIGWTFGRPMPLPTPEEKTFRTIEAFAQLAQARGDATYVASFTYAQLAHYLRLLAPITRTNLPLVLVLLNDLDRGNEIQRYAAIMRIQEMFGIPGDSRQIMS